MGCNKFFCWGVIRGGARTPRPKILTPFFDVTVTATGVKLRQKLAWPMHTMWQQRVAMGAKSDPLVIFDDTFLLTPGIEVNFVLTFTECMANYALWKN